jgi:signal transduction histidine kinase
MPASAVSPATGRFTRWSVLAVMTLVFGGAIAVMTERLRHGMREQILRREADMLAAVASLQLQLELADVPDDVPAAMFLAGLKTQQLSGVSGLRIYDARQKIAGSFMLEARQQPPSREVWQRVSSGRTVARLHTWLSVDPDAETFLALPTDSAFEAWVPLRRNGSAELVGAVQFWMNGEGITSELGEHDGRILRQAVIAWLAGSAVIVATLGWAFRRLDKANRALRARTEDLLRANRELVLAAKTSALGTVAAHLMHEIKNPLAGLESIVANQSDPGSQGGEWGGELAAASQLTRRLRTMVNDVVEVLRDEQTGANFELTPEDIVGAVCAKVEADAAERGIKIDAAGEAAGALTARRANLATLVLRNLMQNALEATPRGGKVILEGRMAPGGKIEFRVEDSGSGLSDSVRARLFQPCASSKVGGSGLGLALSYQLAQQADGRLELVRSDTRGTCFRLVLGPEA